MGIGNGVGNVRGLESIENLASRVLSSIHTAGVPYPAIPITKMESNDYGRLLGDPIVEITVKVENAKGQTYDLIINQVVYSPVMNSYWFVYGFINETLMTGDPEDIQVLTFRWFQNRAYLTPFRLYSCKFLECKLLGIKELAGVIDNIPAITGHTWVQ